MRNTVTTSTFTCDRCRAEVVEPGDPDALPLGWRVLQLYNFTTQKGPLITDEPHVVRSTQYTVLLCGPCAGAATKWVQGGALVGEGTS